MCALDRTNRRQRIYYILKKKFNFSKVLDSFLVVQFVLRVLAAKKCSKPPTSGTNSPSSFTVSCRGFLRSLNEWRRAGQMEDMERPVRGERPTALRSSKTAKEGKQPGNEE